MANIKHISQTLCLGLAAIILLIAGTQPLVANNIPSPAGKVLLSITGNIDNVNDGESMKLDLEMLESLPPHTFTTDTPWTDEPTEFTGVRINDLLTFVGANTHSFRAAAIDKYWNDLQDMDFDSIPAIVAYKKNGEYMRLRDLGPLWIMFPFDDHPELLTEKYKTAAVWQLITIEVR